MNVSIFLSHKSTLTCTMLGLSKAFDKVDHEILEKKGKNRSLKSTYLKDWY